MMVVRRRWILITVLCISAILTCSLFTLDFQYLLPYTYTNIKLRHYYTFQSEVSGHMNNDTLVDLKDFEYLMNNGTICSSSAVFNQPSIVIIVHTARSHFIERYAIRQTWGSMKVYKGWTFHLVFLLGIDPTSDAEFDARLCEESKQNGDMIMGSFVDSYQNLTYKHLMGYKWVNTFCSAATLILKTDDDIFVDIFQLVEVIVVELINSEKSYACQNMWGNKPVRNPDNVWYVSKELYSGEQYPEFCSGGAYLMKTGDAAKIYSICDRKKFLWIDDVYVTGILRESYNFLINNSDSESLDILTLNNRYNLSCRDHIKLWCSTGLESNQLKYTFVLLNKNEIVRDMFCIWNKVRLLKFAMNNAIASEFNGID